MSLRFTKMHGLGNDYVFVSLFDQTVDEPEALARRVADRHRGVGGDGLILVGPPRTGAAHARMQMFNADGSRAEMCGNGVRCVARLAWTRGFARHNPMYVETDAGVQRIDLILDERRRFRAARVDMGTPILEPRRIPVDIDADRVVQEALPLPDATLNVTCVSMGNPHAVTFVDDLDCVPLVDWGPLIERHAWFPRRINAHFAQVLAPDRVRMITWERGAGATQACGSGACAVCVAGVLEERTRRRIIAELPGGELEIEWCAADGRVRMTGPAEEVFDGVWPHSAG